MKRISTLPPYAIAVGAGVLLWVLATAASGRREAWDSALYWTLAYPLSVAVAGYLGYLHPDRPWRWGLAVILAQAAVLTLFTASRGLLPLGLGLFAILALPAVGVAVAAARARAGADARRADDPYA